MLILEQELGVISILVASKNSNINKIYGFEIQKEMAEMANRSVKINSLNDKIGIKSLMLLFLIHRIKKLIQA